MAIIVGMFDNKVGGNILFGNIVVRKNSWQISWHVWQCSYNILYGNIVVWNGKIFGMFVGMLLATW